MNPLERFLFTSFGMSVESGLRYAFFAGIAWLLGYFLFRRHWWHRKIVQRLPGAAEVRRELLYSALTLVVFGAVGATTFLAARAGYTQMYFRLGKHSWGWFATSIVLAIFLHDTYFYWTHRLMHQPRLFRFFHRAHHLSTNPTPWAAYAFGPLEAVVQALIFPLVAIVLPIHPLAFLAFMTWQITFNVLGHTGYEFHRPWMMDSWLGKFLNTPTNHAMHHEHFRGNYGIYFNVWDRLMGTNHECYEARFREVTSRKRATVRSDPAASFAGKVALSADATSARN
jgi:sterol desaturase/sphingolipid hydroxylase (fatty acid hydroxylase superfamily)